MHNRAKDLRMMSFKPLSKQESQNQAGEGGMGRGEERETHSRGPWAGSLTRTRDKCFVRF